MRIYLITKYQKEMFLKYFLPIVKYFQNKSISNDLFAIETSSEVYKCSLDCGETSGTSGEKEKVA